MRTTGERLHVELRRPIRGVAPGQAVVLYDGDAVLGSATIDVYGVSVTRRPLARRRRQPCHRRTSPTAAARSPPLIVRGDDIVAEGVNRVTRDLDPTAHAEVVAIRSACQAVGDFNLAGCVLVSSCEPCPLCLAAALWARVDAIVYAADRHDAARGGFDDLAFYDLFDTPRDQWALPGGAQRRSRRRPRRSTPGWPSPTVSTTDRRATAVFPDEARGCGERRRVDAGHRPARSLRGRRGGAARAAVPAGAARLAGPVPTWSGAPARCCPTCPSTSSPSGWRLTSRPGIDERRASSYLNHDLDAFSEALDGRHRAR